MMNHDVVVMTQKQTNVKLMKDVISTSKKLSNQMKHQNNADLIA